MSEKSDDYVPRTYPETAVKLPFPPLQGVVALSKVVALVERVTLAMRSIPDGEGVLSKVTVRVHWSDYAAAMRERFPWMQHQSDFQICCTGNLAVLGVKVVPAYDVDRLP